MLDSDRDPRGQGPSRGRVGLISGYPPAPSCPPAPLNSQVTTGTQEDRRGSIARRLLRGSIWSLAAAVSIRTGPLLAAIIVARLLGKEAYGEYAYLARTVSTFGVLLGLGLGLTTTKYLAEFRDSDRGRAGRILSLNLVAIGALTLIGTGLMLLNKEALGQGTQMSTTAGELLAMTVFAAGAASLSGVLSAALAGMQAFPAMAISNLAGMVTLLAATIYLSRLMGLRGAIIGLLVGQLLTLLLLCWQLHKCCRRHGIKLTARGMQEELPILWAFALPTAICSLTFQSTQWLSVALLARTNGLGEVAAFEAANQLRMLVTFLPTVMGVVMLPMLTGAAASANSGDYKQTIIVQILLNASCAVLISAPLLIWPEFFMRLYGGSFAEDGRVFQVLVVAGIATVFSGVAGNILAARDRMWLGAGFNISWAVVLLSASAVLVPTHGALGLALAFALAYALLMIAQSAYLRLSGLSDIERNSGNAKCTA